MGNFALAHSSGIEVDQDLESNKSKYNGVGVGTTPNNKSLTKMFYFGLFAIWQWFLVWILFVCLEIKKKICAHSNENLKRKINNGIVDLKLIRRNIVNNQSKVDLIDQ